MKAEPTPNPKTMRFVADRPIADSVAEIRSPLEASRSPLATKLFGFPWMESILIGPDFVAITKQDWVDWDVLTQPLMGLIKEHLDDGLPVLLDEANEPNRKANFSETDSPVVRQIKEILENEIRPAVAMDGGDIVFDRFEEGRVYLFMRGACSGCPSSSYTLKVGIESRLKEAIPEVLEVIAAD